jgi:hypothetical protein
MQHIQTIDGNYKRVNIYLNSFNEYVLRCFKDGAHVIEWNYHTLDKNDAITESLTFLNKQGFIPIAYH